MDSEFKGATYYWLKSNIAIRIRTAEEITEPGWYWYKSNTKSYRSEPVIVEVLFEHEDFIVRGHSDHDTVSVRAYSGDFIGPIKAPEIWE